MAHHLYPMRPSTAPEAAAFAHPNERGILRPRLDLWGIDVGARLIAKDPFYVSEYMVLPTEEYVVVERSKTTGMLVIQSLRDQRVRLEATAEEVSLRFHCAPGQERAVKYLPGTKLLGE